LKTVEIDCATVMIFTMRYRVYKIVNERTGNIVNRVEEYQTAVDNMSVLNCIRDWRQSSRSWQGGIERQLCINSIGEKKYGQYVLEYDGRSNYNRKRIK
jgi:hypothetical protein